MAATQSQPVKVLFVCLGNICRSPTAEGVFRQHLREAGLEDRVEVDSAGTGDYHIGEPPDERARETAARRGYDLAALRARQVSREDFAKFDYILAMDIENLRSLKRFCPPEHGHKVMLFTEFCSKGACVVPDPYGGGPEGFERVLDLVEDASQGLLEHVREKLEI
ncbi:MAG TPA: low molecular weight protein-tyrosine-phosphatase [Burkholderiales bacterium]|nr:low molecular weight protein-tyrosine-phosphatase [Burkholderiales bacterium]